MLWKFSWMELLHNVMECKQDDAAFLRAYGQSLCPDFWYLAFVMGKAMNLQLIRLPDKALRKRVPILFYDFFHCFMISDIVSWLSALFYDFCDCFMTSYTISWLLILFLDFFNYFMTSDTILSLSVLLFYEFWQCFISSVNILWHPVLFYDFLHNFITSDIISWLHG